MNITQLISELERLKELMTKEQQEMPCAFDPLFEEDVFDAAPCIIFFLINLMTRNSIQTLPRSATFRDIIRRDVTFEQAMELQDFVTLDEVLSALPFLAHPKTVDKLLTRFSPEILTLALAYGSNLEERSPGDFSHLLVCAAAQVCKDWFVTQMAAYSDQSIPLDVKRRVEAKREDSYVKGMITSIYREEALPKQLSIHEDDGTPF